MKYSQCASRGKPSGRGFTLIELLSCIAVIVILAAIIVPIGGRALSLQRTATCTSNMRQLAMSLMLYSETNDNKLPDLSNPTWDAAAMMMMSGDGTALYNPVLRCPEDTIARTGSNSDKPRSYAINPILVNFSDLYLPYGTDSEKQKGMQMDRIKNPSKTVMLIEHFDAVNVFRSLNWIASTSTKRIHANAMNVVMCDGSVSRVEPMPSNTFLSRHLSNW